MLASLLFWLFLSFFSEKCQAQYSPGYYTLAFGQSDTEVAVFTNKITPADSLQVMELLISVRSKSRGNAIDSVWFKLIGPEDMKLVRFVIEPQDRSLYRLKYPFRKIPALDPPLTLEIYSRQQSLGKINLQIDRYYVTLKPANSGDTLTFHPNKYKIPCGLSPVKQLIAPKLPDENKKVPKFKHQVKSSEDYKLQER